MSEDRGKIGAHRKCASETVNVAKHISGLHFFHMFVLIEKPLNKTRYARPSWQPGVSGLRVLEGFSQDSSGDRWRVRPRQAVGAAMGAASALAAGVAAGN